MRLTALYSTRNALTARTKQYGLIFVLYRVRRPGSLRLAQSTRLADALAFIARDGQPGASYLHNSGLIIAPSPLDRKAEMAGNERGFRHQHDAMVLRSLLFENPLSGAKSALLTGHAVALLAHPLQALASGSRSPLGVPPQLTLLVT